jgi:N-hydroxyarylamine O-acetyltransferase
MSPLDLDAYRARIGIDGPLAPDLATLKRIHLAHVTTIPFENLDIHLGKPIDIGEDAVARKLIDEGRGGYCFEQNTLLAGVLERFGFKVTRLGARVERGDPRQDKRTHMVLLVHIGRDSYIADVGYGAGELLEPMPFITDTPITQYGRTFTLEETDAVYTLWETGQEKPRDLYRFTLDEEPQAQRDAANRYTSSHPGSIFVRTLTVQRDAIDTIYVLRGRTLETRAHGDITERAINTDEQLLDVLSTTFGLHFSPGTTFKPPTHGR